MKHTRFCIECVACVVIIVVTLLAVHYCSKYQQSLDNLTIQHSNYVALQNSLKTYRQQCEDYKNMWWAEWEEVQLWHNKYLELQKLFDGVKDTMRVDAEEVKNNNE